MSVELTFDEIAEHFKWNPMVAQFNFNTYKFPKPVGVRNGIPVYSLQEVADWDRNKLVGEVTTDTTMLFVSQHPFD